MIEPFVPIFVAVGTGFAVLTSRIYNRIAMLDSKVDKIELRIVQEYVTKGDFNNALTRMEGHLIRMEDKLDAIAKTKCN
jgi:bacterioferritin (cytochrome b1)